MSVKISTQYIAYIGMFLSNSISACSYVA